MGYEPLAGKMLTLSPVIANGAGVLAHDADNQQQLVRLCQNRHDFDVCNWVMPAEDHHLRCLSCRLNRTIPNLSSPVNLQRWRALEQAKRRLIYGLLALGLPVLSQWDDADGLLFDFLEDARSDAELDEGYVTTGHAGGVITINVLEADDVTRESMRAQMNEVYRTLLGHFRHESGHYYWTLLIAQDAECLTQFRTLFGDDAQDYGAALARYYATGPTPGWRDHYISAYASAHPMEDWAETWAHYLHMAETLETAVMQGMLGAHGDNFDLMLSHWMDLTLTLNQLNRSMGLPDAYPFLIPAAASRKLAFVHELLLRRQRDPVHPCAASH